MLVEIKCDEFKSKGTIRPTIEFSEGLNVVLGDSEASNSIGSVCPLNHRLSKIRQSA